METYEVAICEVNLKKTSDTLLAEPGSHFISDELMVEKIIWHRAITLGFCLTSLINSLISMHGKVLVLRTLA